MKQMGNQGKQLEKSKENKKIHYLIFQHLLLLGIMLMQLVSVQNSLSSMHVIYVKYFYNSIDIIRYILIYNVLVLNSIS